MDCKNNVVFLSVMVSLIVLLYAASLVFQFDYDNKIVSENRARVSITNGCYRGAVVVFLIAMLVLFACANSAAAGQ
jgi:hypothetical protein